MISQLAKTRKQEGMSRKRLECVFDGMATGKKLRKVSFIVTCIRANLAQNFPFLNSLSDFFVFIFHRFEGNQLFISIHELTKEEHETAKLYFFTTLSFTCVHVCPLWIIDFIFVFPRKFLSKKIDQKFTFLPHATTIACKWTAEITLKLYEA